MSNPGASAPSSYTMNYDALLTTTLERYRTKMVKSLPSKNWANCWKLLKPVPTN